MKKEFMTITAMMLLLCGCAGKNVPAEEHVSDPQDVSEQTDTEQSAASLWAVEPTMKLDNAETLKSIPFYAGPIIEKKGNPAGWYKMIDNELSYVEDYPEDIITASVDGKFGIMDYEGNVLYPFAVKSDGEHSSGIPIGWMTFTGWCAFSKIGIRRFNADFTETSIPDSTGVGLTAPEPFVRDHQLVTFDHQAGSAVPYTNPWDGYAAAWIMDDHDNRIGCAVMSPDSKIVFETDGGCTEMANGFLSVNENPYNWENPGRYGFYRIADGKDITGGYAYDEVQPFVSGFAPVKKDGKWAFIDEEGRQITDFLFTDATCLYEGKAYVQYEGLYGILDVAAAARHGAMINDADLAGDYHETALVIPENHIGEPIGKLTVLADNLNSRQVASQYAEKLEKAEKGKEYPVYEIYENEGYTWYRIEEGPRWIADNGEWVDYQANGN